MTTFDETINHDIPKKEEFFVKTSENLLLVNMILSRFNIEISDLTYRNTPFNLNLT